MRLRTYDRFLQRHDFDMLPIILLLALVIGFGSSALLALFNR